MSLKRLVPRVPRRLSAQVIYVLLAFAVMVVSCYFYVARMERESLARNAQDALDSTQDTITAELRERETALDAVAETARIMVLRGDSFEVVQGYFEELNTHIRTEGAEVLPYVTGFYGAFDVFGNRLLSRSHWVLPPGYNVKERPWYISGVEAAGRVGHTMPYNDMVLGVESISYARQVFDHDGTPIGVVCLNVEPVRARSYAVDLHLAEGGYGTLLNQNMDIIAHPNPDFYNHSVREVNSAMLPLTDELRRTGSVYEREFVNYQGVVCIAFFERIDIGWYVGVITPKDAYYGSTRSLLVFLIGVGGILALLLSAVLLRMIALKARADERSRIMFEVLPLSTCLIDQDGYAADCNQETLDLFGLQKKEDYLLHFYRFSPEKQPDGRLSRKLATEYIENAFAQDRLHFEWMHQNAAGDLIPCEVTLIKVELDGAPFLSGYVRDMREQKAAAEKLREADERTQIMLDATPLCCCLIDSSMRIVDCNEEAIKLFELSSKKEFIDHFGGLAPEIQPGGANSQEEIFKNVAHAFERGYFRTEFLHQTLGGELIPTEIVLVRVKSRDEYIVAGYIRDLRQLKAMVREMQRIEIAEESNKAKGKFVAAMSHEMRTPLNAILGITEMQLMDETLPYRAQEAFSWVYNSGHTLLHIINDILNLSKIEAGKMELLPVKYETASLINDSAQLNLMLRGSKPIEFRLKIAEDIPCVMLGDELRIKQILSNLLSNAFKYTEKGFVTLSVCAETEEERLDVVMIIRVTDTGIGMTKEQTETIFDAYSRFTTEHTRHSEGTGLGMNITQNLVHMMKGSIEVESEPGKGTTFTVRLPQIRVGFDTLGHETVRSLQQFRIDPSAKLQKNQFKREYMPYGRVLIVDDVESNTYVARGLMAPYGLSIETAQSGAETIQKIEEGRVYDIVFMDQMMPKMDGVETTKRLRAAGYTRPVVALTANAVTGQLAFFMENGFDGFISKPINTRQLNDVLNKMIRDKYPREVVEAARNQKRDIDEQLKPAGIDPELARIFIRDACKAAAILNKLHTKNDPFSDEDINTYIINVHAMKSALASIGQQSLSDFALRLEESVRGRDLSVISTETPLFTQKLLALTDELTEKYEIRSESGAAVAENTALLRKKLAAIAKACAVYNKRPAKDALAELRRYSWTDATNELLDAIAEHLLHSSFEDAGIMAEDAIERLS
ncbi:MAG: response regulator [Oscillospiraceae bacterium]|jgi:signal transduction histidine kinase/CheY-like chemotaxis protein|nr:response regulator [Oscillospiraceae bacterium]